MKVGEVARLLEGIAQGLVDLSKKTADGLMTFRGGMQPYSEQTLEEFVQFLRQCDEYRKTGIVSTGKKRVAPKMPKVELTVTEAADRVRELFNEINRGTVTTPRIDTLLDELKKNLTKPQWEQLLVAIEIAGKPKTKDQAVAKVRQALNSQLEIYVKAQAFGANV